MMYIVQYAICALTISMHQLLHIHNFDYDHFWQSSKKYVKIVVILT